MTVARLCVRATLSDAVLPGTCLGCAGWSMVVPGVTELLRLYCPAAPAPVDDSGNVAPLYRRQLPPLLLAPFGRELVAAAQALVGLHP